MGAITNYPGSLLTQVLGTVEALPYIWMGHHPHPNKELRTEKTLAVSN